MQRLVEEAAVTQVQQDTLRNRLRARVRPERVLRPVHHPGRAHALLARLASDCGLLKKVEGVGDALSRAGREIKHARCGLDHCTYDACGGWDRDRGGMTRVGGIGTEVE